MSTNIMNLKNHLTSISVKDIKLLIRQYNLHHKIRLTQNKTELINDLLKHCEPDMVDNKIITKNYSLEIPKIKEVKPNIKEVKPKIEEVKPKIEEVKEKSPTKKELKEEYENLMKFWKKNMKEMLYEVNGDMSLLNQHPIALRIKELRKLIE